MMPPSQGETEVGSSGPRRAKSRPSDAEMLNERDDAKGNRTTIGKMVTDIHTRTERSHPFLHKHRGATALPQCPEGCEGVTKPMTFCLPCFSVN